MMLILTDNKYLKLGFEQIINQQSQCISEMFIIFDAGDRIFLLQRPELLHYKTPSFFDIYTKGFCFSKQEIKSPRIFIQCLNDCRIHSDEHLYRKISNELSEHEEIVIKELCKGIPPYKIARSLNKSIKTISAQKNKALRKLGMRNIQELHRAIVRWTFLVNISCHITDWMRL